MISKDIVKYYLSSEYFSLQLSDYMDDRKGNCACNNEIYPFKSSIYLGWEKRNTAQAGSMHYYVDLTSKQTEQYFCTNITETQLFAIIFAHWWPLLPEQLALLAQKQNRFCSETLLTYFLVGGDFQTAKKILGGLRTQEEKIYTLHSQTKEKYFIYQPTGIIHAREAEQNCLMDNSGNLYRMCFHWRT